jgi:hypothetical protein
VNDEPRDERRLGRRQRADAEVGWVTPRSRPSWRGGATGRRAIARVIEVSVTGARLVVPNERNLAPGLHAGIEADGHKGLVEVRWVEPGGDRRHATVGVVYLRLDQHFERYVHELTAGPRVDDVRWYWDTAR